MRSPKAVDLAISVKQAALQKELKVPEKRQKRELIKQWQREIEVLKAILQKFS